MYHRHSFPPCWPSDAYAINGTFPSVSFPPLPSVLRRDLDDFATFFAAHNMHSATNPSPVECYYGIYIAGEAAIGNSPMCEVYGGEYISAYRNAVLVGNSNSHDGGEGETAYATIYDGTFISPRNFMTINADENPQYGHGVLSIEGGRFTSAENLDKYIDSTRFEVSAEPVDGYYVVSTI